MRVALVCTECGAREFGDPDWRCPKHPQKTAIQRNHPYFGRALEQPKIRGLQLVDSGKVTKKK